MLRGVAAPATLTAVALHDHGRASPASRGGACRSRGNVPGCCGSRGTRGAVGPYSVRAPRAIGQKPRPVRQCVTWVSGTLLGCGITGWPRNPLLPNPPFSPHRIQPSGRSSVSRIQYDPGKAQELRTCAEVGGSAQCSDAGQRGNAGAPVGTGCGAFRRGWRLRWLEGGSGLGADLPFKAVGTSARRACLDPEPMM